MKSIIHLFHIITLLLIIQLTATAQTDSITKRYNGKNGKAKLLVFDTKTRPAQAANVEQLLYKHLKLNQYHKYKKVKDNTDRHGNLHYTYQQYYKGIKVEFGIYKAHTKNGILTSVNGDCYGIEELNTKPTISEAEALAKALDATGATKYMWKIPEQEQWLKQHKKDTKATYYPKGEIVICEDIDDEGAEKMHLAYKYNIFATEPHSREDVYVDAHTGEIVFRHNRIANINTPVPTKYNGTQTIVTEKVDEDTYRLRDYSRGDGIETFDLKQQGYNYLLAEDYTTNDNIWTASNTYQAAFDAQWGVQVAFDYFLETFGRNSFDGNGTRIQIYTNANAIEENARFIWYGKIGVVEVGNGGSTFSEMASLDILAHEFGHGITFTSANLIYYGESGALNEGFSDIWAACVTNYSNNIHGTTEHIWEMGEDLGFVVRDMSNPSSLFNTYLGLNYPVIYEGSGWYTGTKDYGGVHHNASILYHWFYLLSEGNGSDITGIGIKKAAYLCYDLLTNYLSPSSDYWTIRNYSIIAAQTNDEFSDEDINEIVRTWQKVGVGDDDMISGYITSNTPCVCFGHQIDGTYSLVQTIEFTNNSQSNVEVDITATNDLNLQITPSHLTIAANSTESIQIEMTFTENWEVYTEGDIILSINQTEDKRLPWTFNRIIHVCLLSERNNYPNITHFDATSINNAVDIAEDKDIILVYPGTYNERIWNTNYGKDIKIVSLYYLEKDESYINNTIIDGNNIDGNLIKFAPHNTKRIYPELNGFTIQNFNNSTKDVIVDDYSVGEIAFTSLRNLHIKDCSSFSVINAGARLEIENCLFENCSAFDFINCSGYLRINNSVLRSNIVENNFFNITVTGNSHYLSLENSVIERNTSSKGFFLIQYGTTYFINSKIANNTTLNSTFFASIYSDKTYFINTLLHHNETDNYLLYVNESNEIEFKNTTIADNSCQRELHIAGFNNSNFEYSILWNPIKELDIYLYNAHANFVRSDIQGGKGIITSGGSSSYSYINNLNSDPLFCDATNGDYSLQKGSPCIDTGDSNSPKDPDMSPADIGRYSYNVKEDLILHAEIYAGKKLIHYATNSIVADDVTHVHEGGKLELYCDNSSGTEGITLGNGFHAMPGSDFTAKSREITENCLPQEEIVNLPFSTGTTMLKSGYLYTTEEKEQPKLKSKKTEIGVTVFPNPTENSFTIRLSGIEEVSYRALLFNPLGSIIGKKSISGTTDTEFDISIYPAGMYIVKVITTEKVFAKQVVKY